MDVRQGNHIDPQVIKKLHPGMHKEQVIELVGTPTLQHNLEPNRWDYCFYFKDGATGSISTKSCTLYFGGDKLKKVDCKL